MDLQQEQTSLVIEENAISHSLTAEQITPTPEQVDIEAEAVAAKAADSTNTTLPENIQADVILVSGDDDTDTKAGKAGARNSSRDQKLLKRIAANMKDTMDALQDLGLELDLPVVEYRNGETMEAQVKTEEKAADIDQATLEPSPHNALKALSKTDETLRAGNYIAVWGGRDLEGHFNGRKNKDGSVGEYFTPKTDFESGLTEALKRLPIDWEHRQRPEDDLGPDHNEILGYVDWTTAKSTDLGLWVERVLLRRNKYIQMIEPLIEAGLIGTSSEAIPDMVEKGYDGEIKRWPLKADTLTVTPMEPRMIGENHLVTMKALAEAIPAFAEACQKAGLFIGENKAAKDQEKAIALTVTRLRLAKVALLQD